MAATPRSTNSDALEPIDSSASISTSLAPVVIDLGKRRRKLVKQLRRGKGKLLDDINGAVEELRTAGTLSAASQPVVIIVREKRPKTRSLFPLL